VDLEVRRLHSREDLFFNNTAILLRQYDNWILEEGDLAVSLAKRQLPAFVSRVQQT